MVLDPLVEVREAPDCFEPDADLDPDPPVVAAALPSVDDLAASESVELGASVIVPLAESAAVEDGAADFDDFDDDDVCEGESENFENQHFEYNDGQLLHIPLEELSCLLMIMPSISLNELGHGHAAA